MNEVMYLLIAIFVAIGVAALFTATEEFQSMDAAGAEYPEKDEHEKLVE